MRLLWSGLPTDFVTNGMLTEDFTQRSVPGVVSNAVIEGDFVPSLDSGAVVAPITAG